MRFHSAFASLSRCLGHVGIPVNFGSELLIGRGPGLPLSCFIVVGVGRLPAIKLGFPFGRVREMVCVSLIRVYLYGTPGNTRGVR
jgi:hypothetical protein